MALSCYHCSLDVPQWADDSLCLQQDSQTLHFCCPACKAITEMILGEGLVDYYNKRDGQALAPAQDAQSYHLWDNPTLQAEFVHTQGDNQQVKLFVEGMHCTACAWLIEHHLNNQDAIEKATVNYQQQSLTVALKNDALSVSQLMTLVGHVGYQPHPYQTDQIQLAQQQQRKSQLKRLGITALLMMQLGMLAAGVYAGDYLGISAQHRQLLHAFGLLFSLPLLYVSALPFFSSAFIALKNKTFNMDVNIALAIVGLYAGSLTSVIKGEGDVYFDSIAMLCLFILIARFIEFSSRQQLTQSKPLLPRYVNKQTQGQLTATLVEDIKCDDVLLVQQGETIAFDGVVTEGESTVSEAVMTGESQAIEKASGDKVLAGSTNHDGQLLMRVTHVVGESLLDRIDRLASQAASNTMLTDDKFSAMFTCVIGLLAVITYAGWLLIDVDAAFWVALSVLVISCPCALSLAAPTARAMVQYQLRKKGILIKSSDVLEKTSDITHVFFDKTGTLTQGDLTLVRCINHSEYAEQYLLSLAASLERFSNHPIAGAFTCANIFQTNNVTIVPAKGIEGEVEGTRYRLGSLDFCKAWVAGSVPPRSNQLWVGLCTEDKLLAWFELSDTLRKDAPLAMNQIKQRGKILKILSGDNSLAVDQVASKLGIPFIKSLDSAAKMAEVQKAQQENNPVLMVGDGVNDAPSLSQSYLSLTVNNASDWVKNQTDIVLLSNELQGIETLFASASAYKKIHRQNIVWALGYNAVAIPLAMTGVVTPLFAALGMSLSSIIVVLNSRRLRRLH